MPNQRSVKKLSLKNDTFDNHLLMRMVQYFLGENFINRYEI